MPLSTQLELGSTARGAMRLERTDAAGRKATLWARRDSIFSSGCDKATLKTAASPLHPLRYAMGKVWLAQGCFQALGSQPQLYE